MYCLILRAIRYFFPILSANIIQDAHLQRNNVLLRLRKSSNSSPALHTESTEPHSHSFPRKRLIPGHKSESVHSIAFRQIYPSPRHTVQPHFSTPSTAIVLRGRNERSLRFFGTAGVNGMADDGSRETMMRDKKGL